MAAFSTLAIIGLTAFQAVSQIKQSEREAEATVKAGDLQAEAKGKETRLRAARAKSSFLTSGLTLEGTPMAAIGDIFKTGLEDIDQISTNTNTRAKNIISSGRTQALGTLASGIGGAFGTGDIFGGSAAATGSQSLLDFPTGSPQGFSTTRTRA